MKKIVAITMIVMLLFTGCGKGSEETTTEAPEVTTNVVEETTTAGVPEEKETAEEVTTAEEATTKKEEETEETAQTSIDVVNRYGYTSGGAYDGASELEFQFIEGTVEDCGEYYKVEAEFLEGIKIPTDIQLGDEITVTIDGITGETDVWVYEEEGLVSQNTDQAPAYIMPGDGETETYVYRYSEDRVNRVVYRGPICVSKEAEVEIVVAEMTGTVIKDDLDGGFYHKLFFDENGFVTQILYTGD